ncbi:type II secretion system F family protein, partial [Planctomycetota bacterium]
MGVSREDIFYFTKEFTALLHTGTSEVEALEHIQLQTRKRGLKKLIRQLIERMKDGCSFSEALGRYRKELPFGYIETAVIGEETSTLKSLLSEYTDMLGRWINIKQRILQLCIYPAILLVISGIILISVSILAVILPAVYPFSGSLYKYLGFSGGFLCFVAGLTFLFKIPVYKIGNIFPGLQSLIINKFPPVRNLCLTYISSIFSVLLKGGVS